MLTNNFQQSPYLRIQRMFPREDIEALSRQIDQAYIDIATKVNQRVIGIFSLSFPIITGETWYFTGSSTSQQSLRQIYTFTTTAPIPHGLNWAAVSKISPRSYGTFLDDTGKWGGVIYASNVAIAGQYSFYVDDTNIVILAGAGAPTLVSGVIVLEYISNF